jgi:hypothetical protein
VRVEDVDVKATEKDLPDSAESSEAGRSYGSAFPDDQPKRGNSYAALRRHL